MSNNNVIQVPPNFIINKYKAVKRLTKRVPLTAGVSFEKEAGVTYEFGTYAGFWTVQSTTISDTTGDAVMEFYVSMQISTLGDLFNSGKPLTINIPNIDFANGDTARLHGLGAISPDANFTGTQQAFTLNEIVPGWFAANWTNSIDFNVRVTLKGSIRYVFDVPKTYYPFPYETKYIGLGNVVPYIAMANPTFIDIDISSLFLNPGAIPCSEGDIIYLLHKNTPY